MHLQLIGVAVQLMAGKPDHLFAVLYSIPAELCTWLLNCTAYLLSCVHGVWCSFQSKWATSFRLGWHLGRKCALWQFVVVKHHSVAPDYVLCLHWY